MIITLKGADFSQSNIGTLSTYSIRFNSNGITNTNTSVDRETNTGYTATITFKENYELNGAITVTMGGADITSTAVSGLNINIAEVTGNVVITVPAKSTVVEPETPTNYTFTINPTPTSATVTLSATGYSTVSGTGSKSITVANGTTVSWSVSASGYTSQNGSWTANGSNKTENIVLSAISGGEEDGTEIDITDRIKAKFTAGAVYHVMNTDSGGGAHAAQTAYQSNNANDAFVNISEYAGKKLKITVPNALVEAHNKYGTVFYTGTSKSTAIYDYGYAMVYDANYFQVPTATIVEIDIPTNAVNIKTTWHTAENEAICDTTFSAKVIV